MGKKVQCCFKAKRSHSSSSSSSSDYCPTSTTGAVSVAYEDLVSSAAPSDREVFKVNVTGALTLKANAFAISGVSAGPNVYVTPTVCDGGVARGFATWGNVYVVEKAPSPTCEYPYVYCALVATEQTGIVSNSVTPATFEIKLRRNQALAFVRFPNNPVYDGEDELVSDFGNSYFSYTFYPSCTVAPCSTPMYM